MKETRRQGTEKLRGIWQNLTSGINNKININAKANQTEKKEEPRDMGSAHTPISRLDLTGMNRTQAKEMISKLIDERLEEISHIELTELRIDPKERERERAKAAERINERRTRRKQHATEQQTIVTEQGIYAHFEQNASLEEIVPEPEAEQAAMSDPIEGQLSLMDFMAADSGNTEFGEDQNVESTQIVQEVAAVEEAEATEGPITLMMSQVIEAATAAVPDQIVKVATAAAAENSAAAAVEREQIMLDRIETNPQPEATSHAVEALPQAVEALDQAAETLPHAVEALPQVGGMAIEKVETSEDQEANRAAGFDFFGLLKYDPDREGITEEEAERLAGLQISTVVDETLDKLFVRFNKIRNLISRTAANILHRTGLVLREKIQPFLQNVHSRINSRVIPLLQKAEARLKLKDKWTAVAAASARQERKAAAGMGAFVEFLDRKNEAFIHLLVVFRDKAQHRMNVIRDYAERHKKLLLTEFGAVVAVAAVVTIIIGNMTAYEYVYNGKVLGVVKNQEDVYKTIDIIGDKLSTQYDADITIDKNKDIRFRKVIALHQDVDGKDDILNRLTYMRDMKANGKGIYLDGKLVAVLESDITAQDILQTIQNSYLSSNTNVQYKKVGFAQKVEIKDVETKLGSIESKEKVIEYLMTGAVEKKIHAVQSGETFSEIAKMYGLKQSELKASNPDVIPEKLSIGQEICLNQIVPMVTVQTTEVAQYKESIPFEVTYENTANLYKNEKTVKSKGANGEKDVVAEIVRNNGIEVSRSEISVTVLAEPVSQVVLVGTKDPPPLIGTGSFIYPVRGRLSSSFGYRWGRLHSGIDLAAPIGTTIKAADGGKVTFAGYNGSLGYMVEIDHGGGRVTWYGHCSKLLVKKGDKVYQGQHIANVGNTGRSTGPHCHFEVHINGVAKNPIKYL